MHEPRSGRTCMRSPPCSAWKAMRHQSRSLGSPDPVSAIGIGAPSGVQSTTCSSSSRTTIAGRAFQTRPRQISRSATTEPCSKPLTRCTGIGKPVSGGGVPLNGGRRVPIRRNTGSARVASATLLAPCPPARRAFLDDAPAGQPEAPGASGRPCGGSSSCCSWSAERRCSRAPRPGSRPGRRSRASTSAASSAARGRAPRRAERCRRARAGDVRRGGREFRFTASQLGVRSDWSAAVARRQGATNGLGPVRGVRRLRSRLFGVDVQPRPRPIRRPSGSPSHGSPVRSIARPSMRACVTPACRRRVVPERAGCELDRAAASSAIVASLASLERGERRSRCRSCADAPTTTAAELAGARRRSASPTSAP